MTELYARVLLWHKLVAQTTGGLALCSAKHKLNRDEAYGWAVGLENVAADIRQFLDDGTFILDGRGQRVVRSDTEGTKPQSRFFDSKGEQHVAGASKDPTTPSKAASSLRAGGLRIAKRKTTK